MAMAASCTWQPAMRVHAQVTQMPQPTSMLACWLLTKDCAHPQGSSRPLTPVAVLDKDKAAEYILLCQPDPVVMGTAQSLLVRHHWTYTLAHLPCCIAPLYVTLTQRQQHTLRAAHTAHATHVSQHGALDLAKLERMVAVLLQHAS